MEEGKTARQEGRDRGELLEGLIREAGVTNMTLARLDERVVGMVREAGRSEAAQEHRHNDIKAIIGTLATKESVDALTLRVSKMESSWTWLLGILGGTPVIAILTYFFGFRK